MMMMMMMMMMMQMSWELNVTSSASLPRSLTRPSRSWPASRRRRGTAADEEEEQEDAAVLTVVMVLLLTLLSCFRSLEIIVFVLLCGRTIRN